MSKRKTAHQGGKLNEKQEAFCKEYLIDLNATQAAIRAGYKPEVANKCGPRLLVNVGIKNRIDELKKARSQRLELKGDDVLRRIGQVIDRCMQAEPVLDAYGMPVMVKTPNGDLSPAYTFDSRGALKGLELQGKHLKLFTDRVEIKDKTNRADRLARIRARLNQQTK